MAVTPSGWSSLPGARRLLPHARRTQLVLVACVAAAAAFLASQTPAMRFIDNRIFDYLSTMAPPPVSERGPVVVAIDEPSMAEVGRQWPWPRGMHGRLIESLRAAGARAIGLDIIFAEPSDPAADAALAAALGPDVVLAGDVTLVKSPRGDQLIRVEPLEQFMQTGARLGLAGIPLDADGVVRRLPEDPENFSSVLMDVAGIALEVPPPLAMMQALGPARTVETVSYYQALDPGAFLPPDFFRDRVVLIGLSTQSAPTIDAGGADMYATPITARTARLVAGVEVQATVFENLARGLWISSAPVWTILLVTIAGAAWGVAVAWRPARMVTLAGTLLGGFALAVLSFLLLRHQLLFASPGAPIAALALTAGGQAGLDFARERRLRAGIVRAFSQYLSPVLVERLAEQPDTLALEGQRRELTVLFCDVRGFTTIAERLKDDPERLTTLMNRLITPLTEAVLNENGTVDKYIGDCVMAFWNAPLDVPDHPARAVRAALAMLEAIDRLNAELAAEAGRDGTAPVVLRIGVGVNTGDCVVGNMGSALRFAYTAMGDPVNLASRLESESKTMAVPLLVGEATARRLPEQLAAVPLQRVHVKGKTEPVRPFTVLRGQSLSSEAAKLHAEFVDCIDLRAPADTSQVRQFVSPHPELDGYYASQGQTGPLRR